MMGQEGEAEEGEEEDGVGRLGDEHRAARENLAHYANSADSTLETLRCP